MTRTILLLSVLVFGACERAARLESVAPTNESAAVNVREKTPSMMFNDGQTDDRLIWKGQYGPTTIIWTTNDLMFDSNEGNVKFFSSLAAEDLNIEKKKSKSAGIKDIDCRYEREFALLSVVGGLLSFEDKRKAFGTYAVGNDSTHLSDPGTESIAYATIDLQKDRKKVKLSEYFDGQEILRELLKDDDFRQAFLESGKGKLPKTLSEIEGIARGDNILFKNYKYVIYPNFLYNFAFENVIDNKAKVKLIFPFFQDKDFLYTEVPLLLSIPQSLAFAFDMAQSKQEGFLMKDASRIRNGRSTKVTFKCRGS